MRHKKHLHTKRRPEEWVHFLQSYSLREARGLWYVPAREVASFVPKLLITLQLKGIVVPRECWGSSLSVDLVLATLVYTGPVLPTATLS